MPIHVCTDDNDLKSKITAFFAAPATAIYGLKDLDISAVTTLSYGNLGGANIPGARVWDASGINQSSGGNADITGWDTSKVTSMRAAFIDASGFNQDISSWDTSKVTEMGYTFQGANTFDQDLRSWNVDGVTNFEYMFNHANAIRSSSSVNKTGPNGATSWSITPERADFTFPVKNSGLFTLAIAELKNPSTGNGGITNGLYTHYGYPNTWKYATDAAGNLTDMSGLFYDGTVSTTFKETFNAPLSDWKTGNVTDMSGMFRDASGFNQDLSSWVTSAVTDMTSMFSGATSFVGTGGLATSSNVWNTDVVTNMSNMFKDAVAFNQDISSWATNSVLNMSSMFHGAKAFNYAIPTDGNKWKFTTVTDMSNMFNGAIAFNQVVKNWDVVRLAPAKLSNMFTGATAFDSATKGYGATEITSGTPTYKFFSLTSSDFTTALTDWFGAIPAKPWKDIGTWNVSAITDFSSAFTGRTGGSTTSVNFNDNIADWDMGSATSLANMFYGAEAFNQDLSAWDVTKVSNMGQTFRGAIAFNNGEVSTDTSSNPLNWTTTALTNMERTFQSAKKFNQTLPNWDTSGVTTFNSTFRDAWVFNQDITAWNTSAATNSSAMNNMFKAAKKFNQDISSWDVSSVTKFNDTFGGALEFNQDLRSWNVDKVTSFTNMFNGVAAALGAPTTPTIAYFTLDVDDAGKFQAARKELLNPTSINGLYTVYGFPNTWAWPTAAAGIGNLGNVTDLSNFFKQDGDPTPNTAGSTFKTTFNASLSDWRTGNVTTMEGMFQNCEAYNQAMALADTSKWDVSKVTTMKNMFNGAKVFNQALSTWVASSVLNMSSMFEDAEAFNQYIGDWNTTDVSDMSSMFKDCDAFNNGEGASASRGSPLKWNVIKATTMTNMFKDAFVFDQNLTGWAVGIGHTTTDMFSGTTRFNANTDNTGTSGWSATTPEYKFFSITGTQSSGDFKTALDAWFATPQVETYGDIVGWNVSKITNFANTFSGKTSFNEDIGDWEMESAMTLENMFSGAVAFNQDLSGWNVGNVTNMQSAFQSATAFNNGEVGTNTSSKPLTWTTTKLATISSIFHSAAAFNQDITGWNTAKVTNMSSAFYGASLFTQDINTSGNNWKTELVTNMTNTFYNAAAFNGNISSWDVGEVTSLSGAFYGATVFNSNISSWDVSAVTTFGQAFYNAARFDQSLSTWNVDAVTAGNFSNMFSGADDMATTYSAEVGWGTTPTAKFFVIPLTSANIDTAVQESITATTDTNGGATNTTSTKYGHMIDWDVSKVTNMNGLFNTTFSTPFNADLSNWNTSAVTDMASMFEGRASYTASAGIATGVNKWGVSLVTDMSNMFKGATGFNANISTWETQAVKDMSSMFNGATSFNAANGGLVKATNVWNTSAVTDMSSMFNGATGFSQNLSSWETHEVTNMASMFNGATSFAATGGMTKSSNQWNTVKVSDMSSMFKNAPLGFNPSIGNWTTSAVTDMSGMFEGATGFNNGGGTALTWDVGSVTTMASMFKGAIAFDQDLSSWKTYVGNVKNMTSIFEGASVFGTTTATNEATNIRDWEINETESSGTQLNLTSAFKDAPEMAENVRYWDVANGVTTTDIFSGATAYLASDHAGTDHTNWNNGSPGYQYFDYTGTVCFLGSEKVRTDQGLVRFDKLTTDYTINGYNIKKVTKMLNADNYLIFIKKNAVNKNIPNKGTYISRNHGIVMNNHIVRAKTLENGTTVLKIPRDPDMIYNVLTIPQTIMFVNNMPCETINPNDPIVQRYI